MALSGLSRVYHGGHVREWTLFPKTERDEGLKIECVSLQYTTFNLSLT